MYPGASPVWKLLGGKHRDGVEVAHSLGIMEIEAAVDEAAAVAVIVADPRARGGE